ncbi:MAG TPA: DUF2993 domain-containing protein [Streptosporangiaceae bacterium]
MYQYQPPKRSAGRKALIWVIAILVVLVALDFGAKAFAESEAATQIQKQGFPKKPDVSIAGFPFLLQVVTRDFHQVTISSSDIPEGPIKITSLDVVAQNVKLKSNFQSGTAGPLNGTLRISLGAIGGFLSDAGPLAGFLGGGSNGGLKIVAVGSNELKASLNLVGGIVNAGAVWRVTPAGPHAIELHLVSSNGLPSQLLDSARNVKIPLKSLPAGLELTGKLSSSSGGIVAHVFARHLAFG